MARVSSSSLPVEEMGPAQVIGAQGAPAQLERETEALLREILKAGSLVVILVLGGFLVRDIMFSTLPYSVAPRAALIAIYAALGVLLVSRRPLRLRQLRACEFCILWLVALWFATDRYHFTLEWAVRRDVAQVMFAIDFSVLAYLFLSTTYGIFVPNTWRRALKMVGAMVSMPVVVLLAVRVFHPEEFAFIWAEVLAINHVTSLALMLLIGLLVPIWGVHLIHSLRRAAFEAKQLGQYTLTERIGAGGMGEVWKAKHRLLVRPAAIKLIKPEMVSDVNPARSRAFIQSFEREAQSTASLRSTHTVELYDFGITEDASFFYVMELLNGLDLETLVEHFGAVPATRAVYLLLQACDSLAEAHARGLIHRDVKPANLYVCRMGLSCDFVKVLDFGLVRAEKQRTGDATGGGEGLLGTPGYMAPEIVLGTAEASERSDIYALGCVCYWLLTGSRVFECDTPVEVAMRHVNTTPVPPSQATELPVPTELDEIVLACLHKEPSGRPQTVEELSRLLLDCDLEGGWSQRDARRWWSLHMNDEGAPQTLPSAGAWRTGTPTQKQDE